MTSPPDSAAAAPRRIGYLVPQFPGQTHAMFWREIEQLERAGVSPVLLTTRAPAGPPVAHGWAAEARRRTIRLWPLAPSAALRAGGRVLRRSGRVVRTLRRDATSGPDALRLLAAFVLGAHVCRVTRQQGLDHVHVHSCAWAADVMRLAQVLGGPGYSLTLHGPPSDYGGHQRQKWAAARFGIVITASLRDDLVRELGDSIPAYLGITGMTLPPGRFERTKPYVPREDPSAALRLFCCARLNPAKGYPVLVDAIDQLANAGHRVELRIAGEDDAGGNGYRRTLEDLISARGLTGTIRLLGAVPEAEVVRELHAAHAFVLASHAEPLGVVVLEAMAAGVPVVATAAGGIPDLVTDGVDGLLVPAGDAHELARTLARLMSDPDLAVGLARAGAATARLRAAQPSSADVLLGLLDASRNQPRGPA